MPVIAIAIVVAITRAATVQFAASFGVSFVSSHSSCGPRARAPHGGWARCAAHPVHVRAHDPREARAAPCERLPRVRALSTLCAKRSRRPREGTVVQQSDKVAGAPCERNPSAALARACSKSARAGARAGARARRAVARRARACALPA